MKQFRSTTWSVFRSPILLVALALGGVGCHSGDREAASRDAVEAESSQSGELLQGGMPAIEGRKIIYTGALSLTVKSYEKARAEIDSFLRNNGGFVSRGETLGTGDDRYATLVLRVPTANFAALSSQLKALGEVESETIAADDVTEQHVDLSARLSNARTLEARLLELVAGKTDSVADLLVVEAELGRVREHVERLDAQLRNMDNQVGMATLTLSIYTGQQEVAGRGLGNRMSGALAESFHALADSGAALMVVMSALLPWALLLTLLCFAFLRARNAAANRKLANARQR